MMVESESAYEKRSKREQRRFAKSARNAIGSGLAARKSLAAVSRVLAHEAFLRAETILVYSAHHRELDISELAETARAIGKRVAYPVMDGKGMMIAAIPDMLATGLAMETGRYGELKPNLCYARIVLPSELDFVLVPGLAFDRKGQRVGWGTGHYDRFLPLCVRAFFMGIAYEEQIMETLSADNWDTRMHAIATDCAIYNVPACCESDFQEG